MIAWWSYALRRPSSSQVCWTRNDDVQPVLAFPGRACRWACRCGSQLTVTPLGIRRNKSRVAHIPGTTAAGRLQYVAGLLSSCVRACNTSPSVPAPPQICDCEHTCCATGFVWADCHGGQMGSGHTWHHQDMADPAFRMCLDLRRQEFRGMEARPSMGAISRHSRILRRSKLASHSTTHSGMPNRHSTACCSHFLGSGRELLPGESVGQGSTASLASALRLCFDRATAQEADDVRVPSGETQGYVFFLSSLVLPRGDPCMVCSVYEDRCQIYHNASTQATKHIN